MPGVRFLLEPDAEYLIRARTTQGDTPRVPWNAGTHVQMIVGDLAHSTKLWVPISVILPWPTLEAFQAALVA